MKPNRQSIILKIIQETDVETQTQLMEELKKYGIKSTQATLSRDIKDLRLVKELGPDGAYRYAIPGKNESSNSSGKLKAIFKECVISYDIAQNIVVIKTLPGLASAACSAIDSLKMNDLVGSIAGDDTAFLAMRDNESAARLVHEFEALFD